MVLHCLYLFLDLYNETVCSLSMKTLFYYKKSKIVILLSTYYYNIYRHSTFELIVDDFITFEEHLN